MRWPEVLRRRTCRRFEQKPVPDELLRNLIDAARVASCGGNFQHLRYLAIRTPELTRLVFDQTNYGGHVRPGRNPVWGVTAPVAFIAQTGPADAGSTVSADAGAAMQSMEFAACDCGLGCCWVGAFNRANVTRLLEQPADRQVMFLLAVGWPAEQPVLENIDADGDTRYYLDASDVLHVPKYTVDAITTWL